MNAYFSMSREEISRVVDILDEMYPNGWQDAREEKKRDPVSMIMTFGDQSMLETILSKER